MTHQNKSEHLIDYIKNLEKTILLIIKTLEDIKENSKIEYNYKIDKIDIHSPKLDELNFFLEKIDVKELSGAMNIGNTLGTNVGQKQNLSKEKEQDKAKKDFLTKIKANKTNPQDKGKENSNEVGNSDENAGENQAIKVVVNGKPVSHSITTN